LFKPSTLFNVNILPIVRGAKFDQYKRVSPKNSFIDASKFSNPKELANFLNYLNENRTAYTKYFEWKFDLFDKFGNQTYDKIQSYKKPIIKTKDLTYNYEDGYQSRIDKMHTPFCAICSLLHNDTYLNNSDNRKWIISDWFGRKKNCWDYDEKRNYLFLMAQLIGFCF
jgi:hypothetical protein